jgi:hypothetical protein
MLLESLMQQRNDQEELEKKTHADIQNREIQVKTVKEKQSQTEMYYCEKIAGNCPFVDAIKKTSIHALTDQQHAIQQQISFASNTILPTL